MSLAGLKKQLNKANQYVSEKVAGVKGTELDEVCIVPLLFSVYKFTSKILLRLGHT